MLLCWNFKGGKLKSGNLKETLLDISPAADSLAVAVPMHDLKRTD